MNQQPRKKPLVIACKHAMAVMFSCNAIVAAAQEADALTAVEVQQTANSTESTAKTLKQKRDEKLEEADIERIEVTGFAGAVAKALMQKRHSNGVVDSIIAEDMGKMADSNVAEALQRMAGISIDRDGGEGTTISVRGMGPEMNQVTINGQTMQSSGSASEENGVSGGVSFDTLSADMLGAIEVIKSPSASTTEGSLGGQVNLRTRMPLDSKSSRFTGQIKQTYNELSENIDPTFQVNYINHYFDRKVGIAVGASVQRNRSRRDQISTNGWVTNTFINHNIDGHQYMGYANPDNTLLVDPDSPLFTVDGDGNIFDENGAATSEVQLSNLVVNPQTGYNPTRFDFTYRTRDTETKNFNLTAQYKPNDDLSTYLTFSIYDRYVVDETSRARTRMGSADGLAFDQFALTNDSGAYGVNGHFTKLLMDENGTVVRGENILGRREAITSRQDTEKNGGTLGLGFEYGGERWIASGRVGYSLTKESIPFGVSNSANVNAQADVAHGYDVTFDPQIPEYILANINENGEPLAFHGASAGNLEVDGQDINNIAYGDIVDPDTGVLYQSLLTPHAYILSSIITERDTEDTNISGQVDFEYLLDSEHFSAIKFGAMYTKTTSDRFTFAGRYQLHDDMARIYLNTEDNMIPFPVDNFMDNPNGSGLAYQGPVTEWVFADYNQIRKEFLDVYNSFYENRTVGEEFTPIETLDDLPIQRDIRRSYNVEQEYQRAYVQVDVDTFDGRLLGDFGLRFVQTNIDTSAYSGENNTKNICKGGVTWDEELCRQEFILEERNNDYFEVLPSANFKFLITDDLISRFTVSRAMARPSNFQVSPYRRATTSTNARADNATVRVGNPELEPTKATMYDLSLEWYFNKSSILSAGLFYKDFDSFVYQRNFLVEDDFIDDTGQTVSGSYTEYVNGVLTQVERNINPYVLIQPVNGDSASILGLEARYSHHFDFLPGDWSGLGVDLNYTYADSEAVYEGVRTFINDLGVRDRETVTVDTSFQNQSKHTYNASVYWEKYGHSARLSYNYRTDSLRTALTGSNDSLWNDAYGQVDISSRYKLSKYLRFGLDITNLLNEGSYRYHMSVADGSPLEGKAYRNRLGNYELNGRAVRLSINATF